MFNKLFKKQTKTIAYDWTRAMWNEELWMKINWLGMPILQWPTDLAVLQELIYELQPKYIIETGTHKGGTAVFFASILSLLNNNGRVISIEKHISKSDKDRIARHPLSQKIHLIQGSSTSQGVISKIKQITGKEKKIMVFLDSDHSYKHVLNELRLYQQFIPLGGYLCAFDTVMKDLYDLSKGQQKWKYDNPNTAVIEFLKENSSFEVDVSRNKLLIGFAPNGFLKRIKPQEI